MNVYRNTFVLLAVLFIILLVIFGPCRKRGPGIRGVIDPVGKGPTWVTVGDDRIFVSNMVTSTIDCFFLDSGKYAGRMENVTYVGRTLYSPVTGKLYAVAGEIGAGILLQIDPKTYETEQKIPLELECRAMALSPDGKHIYTVWGGWREGPGWFTRNATDDFQTFTAVGNTRESPTDILLSADGKKAYVSSHYAQRSLAEWLGDEDEPGLYSVVEVFDTTDGLTRITEIRVGLKPQSMAAFGDGRYIIVASAGLENEVLGLPGFSIIDTQTDEVIKEIYTPGYFPLYVVASDELGKAFATYLYKVPILAEESAENEIPPDESSDDDQSVESGIIEIEISGGVSSSENNIDESPGETGETANGPMEEPGTGDENVEYIGINGKGFLAVDLNDYTVDIYEDERGWPFYSLCLLDDRRMIAVSSLANKLIVLEAQETQDP